MNSFFNKKVYAEVTNETTGLTQVRYDLIQPSELHCMSACVTEDGCTHMVYDGRQCYLIVDGTIDGELSSYVIQPTEFIYTKYGPVATSCTELHDLGYTDDGIYLIKPDMHETFKVYCELEPVRTDGSNQAGWTVFQRRVDASIDFYRYWADYEEGFGDITGNYWLGLRKLARLASHSPVQLHVYLETFDNDWAYALYNYFQISDASLNYMLRVSGYSGTAGDALAFVNNAQFSTRDRDNDRASESCAIAYQGAFWYSACHAANLNGLYHEGAHDSYADGVNWDPYRGHYYSLKTTIMKIRTL